ncbi:MAG: DUF2088 domain-containing protein [Desulfobacteraceae bacterium]|nr:MAG: DUF2088 domain-containing protein [Desulfobacteraceae bacterium]
MNILNPGETLLKTDLETAKGGKANMTGVDFPKMALVGLSLYDKELENVSKEVSTTIASLSRDKTIRPGQTIAVSAGSRGIDRIDEVTRSCVDVLKGVGAKPFIFPAMGSHGGATADGQKTLLAHLGITEESMGVPVRSSMEVIEVGVTHRNVPVYLDGYAADADALVVINRIKTHTKFEGDIESGLFKMMAIGMGKHQGASVYHRAAVDHGMEAIIIDAGLMILKRCPVLFGLGVVENGLGRVTELKAVLPGQMMEEEKRLLALSKKVMAKIPFDHIDLLIVDEMGKNISGTGMDSKVIGRHRDLIGDFWIHPHPKRIFVRDLTDLSDGNATGVGLADFITHRLAKRIDRDKTVINCLTGLSPEKAAIPIAFPNDKEAIGAALETVGIKDINEMRVVNIQNTRNLDRMFVSEAFLPEIERSSTIEQISSWLPMPFDKEGNLISPF